MVQNRRGSRLCFILESGLVKKLDFIVSVPEAIKRLSGSEMNHFHV